MANLSAVPEAQDWTASEGSLMMSFLQEGHVKSREEREEDSISLLLLPLSPIRSVTGEYLGSVASNCWRACCLQSLRDTDTVCVRVREREREREGPAVHINSAGEKRTEYTVTIDFFDTPTCFCKQPTSPRECSYLSNFMYHLSVGAARHESDVVHLGLCLTLLS